GGRLNADDVVALAGQNCLHGHGASSVGELARRSFVAPAPREATPGATGASMGCNRVQRKSTIGRCDNWAQPGCSALSLAGSSGLRPAEGPPDGATGSNQGNRRSPTRKPPICACQAISWSSPPIDSEPKSPSTILSPNHTTRNMTTLNCVRATRSGAAGTW